MRSRCCGMEIKLQPRWSPSTGQRNAVTTTNNFFFVISKLVGENLHFPAYPIPLFSIQVKRQRFLHLLREIVFHYEYILLHRKALGLNLFANKSESLLPVAK